MVGSGKTDPGGERGELKFHYNRNERLKKLHHQPLERRGRPLSRKRKRGLLIIIVDLFLIALVFYYVNKPANVFLEERKRNLTYELNVTGIRGKKILIGLTMRNQGNEDAAALDGTRITLVITPKTGDSLTFHKQVESGTVLQPGESSSIIFLLNEQELPGWGLLELYIDNEKVPLFSKTIRF